MTMEVKLSRVLLLLSSFSVGLLAAPAAQEVERATQRPSSHHSIQFPGQDTFLAIAGLKNNTDTNRPTERTSVPTTYRPQFTHESAQAMAPTVLATSKPLSESESADCRDNYIWNNVSPYDQEKQSFAQVDSQLSVEAMFTITNRLEALISDKNVNILYSPLGLTSVLGQLMLAARGNTLKQLENLLAPGRSSCRDGAANKFHYSFRFLVSQLWRRLGSESYELSARNALFYQSPGQALNQGFTRRLSAEYATEIFSTNFKNNPESSLKRMNDWASEASRRKINQLVPEVPPRTTSAVMSSVVYFKASWENVFNKQYTGPAPFYLDGGRNGRVKTVNFMVAEFEVPYAESADLGCRILALPYTNNETVLYVVMPLGPPKRRRPSPPSPPSPPTPTLPTPTLTTFSRPIASPPSQNNDIPLVARIQEVEPEGARPHTTYGDKILPSQVVDKTPLTFFYSRDAVVYPGPPHAYLAPFLQNAVVRRQRRQHEPCSDASAASTSTTRPMWWTTTTTTTSPPCLEDRSSIPGGESPLSPSNLHKLASRLGPSEFSRLVSQMRNRRVSVILPKLSMSSNVKLKDALASLGVPSVFGADADLSGAVDKSEAGREGWWKVDEVWQQSRLDVDEDGTEAASGTAVGIVDYGGDSVVFKANTPFLAVVRHEATGAPIFWASVVDPS